MKVVGTINNSRRHAPNLCLNPEMNSIEPTSKQMIAKINKNVDKVGDMFLFEITTTVRSKLIILPGIA